MDAPGFRIHMGLERIGIGRFQLRHLPPVQHPGRQVMAFGGEVFQHVGACRIGPGLALLATRKAHLVEQDLAQLLGRADIEFRSGDVVDLVFQPGHFLGEDIRHPGKMFGIDLDPGHFHFGQNRHHRTFQRLVSRSHGIHRQLRAQHLPQPPGHLGILAGIGRGTVERHLIEGDLRLAGTDQILDRLGLVAQHAFGQPVHAMAEQVRAHRIGHQHRILDRGHADPVPGEDLPVVFDVLPDLQDRGILQHRLQPAKHQIHRQLPVQLRAGTEQVAPARDMADRDIAGHPGRRAKRDADQIRDHLVKAGGLGVDGDGARLADGGDPAIQIGLGGDSLVVGDVDFRPVGAGGGLRRAGCGLVGNGGGLGAEFFGHAIGQRAELHPGQEAQQGLGVGVGDFQTVEGEIQRRPAIQLHQPLRDADLVGEVDQGLAALGLLDLAGIGQQVFQIAIFVDQQRRRLDPDSRRAGDVVDRIARQRLNIDDTVGADAEFLLDLVGADLLALDRVEHDHAAADQLHQVLVRTDDRRPSAGLARMAGQRGDDVVGLVAFDLDTGDVEGPRRLARQRELRPQLLGQGRAVGLVVRVDVVAEGLGTVIEDHRDMGRRIAALGVLHVFPQHVAEPGHRTDGQPVGFAGQGRQRVEGAEDEGRSVDQVKMVALAEGGGHARLLLVTQVLPQQAAGAKPRASRLSDRR